MFERYQLGTNAVMDTVVTTYDRLRAFARQLDDTAAVGVDRLRRNRRKLERVDNLDRTITETISVLAQLEGDAGVVASDLRDTRTHLQWVLTTLRS